MKLASTLKVLFIFASLSLFGAGCSLFGGSATSTVDGGVYQSSDYGSTWQAINFVGTARDGDITISHVNTRKIYIHPTDSNILYLLTMANGLYRSINGGAQWNKVNEAIGNISVFTIDPIKPETLYAIQGNRIISSIDAGVNWQPIYIESDIAQLLTTLLVDFFDNTKLYVGTSKGTVLFSDNTGQTWRVKSQLGKPITSMEFSPVDSRTIYTLTLNQGIWLSEDAGVTWSHFTLPLTDIDSSALLINDYNINPTSPVNMLVGTNHGLIQNSTDAGWQVVQTTILPNTLPIRTVAYDTLGNPIIYFTVDNKIHRSTDNGAHWTITQLPTARWISELVVDSRDSTILYVGFNPAR